MNNQGIVDQSQSKIQRSSKSQRLQFVVSSEEHGVILIKLSPGVPIGIRHHRKKPLCSLSAEGATFLFPFLLPYSFPHLLVCAKCISCPLIICNRKAPPQACLWAALVLNDGLLQTHVMLTALVS